MLETRQVTREDLQELSKKVDALVASEARQEGGVSAASWSLTTLAPWLALLVALLALMGVGPADHQPQPSTHLERRE